MIRKKEDLMDLLIIKSVTNGNVHKANMFPSGKSGLTKATSKSTTIPEEMIAKDARSKQPALESHMKKR